MNVAQHKSRPFQNALSMSTWPAGSIYVGSIQNYLICLPDPFPRDVQIDLEESSTFPKLLLLMLHQ